MRRFLLACCLIFVSVALPSLAAAQSRVHQCVGGSGETLYSDKPCAAFGATDRVVPRMAPAGATTSLGPSVRPGCARTLDDLVHEITMAFDTNDPDRLVGVYHWPGLDTRSGYAIADRLKELTRQQLVEARANGDRVRLQLARGENTSTQDFRLRRYRDCWWISY